MNGQRPRTVLARDPVERSTDFFSKPAPFPCRPTFDRTPDARAPRPAPASNKSRPMRPSRLVLRNAARGEAAADGHPSRAGSRIGGQRASACSRARARSSRASGAGASHLARVEVAAFRNRPPRRQAVRRGRSDTGRLPAHARSMGVSRVVTPSDAMRALARDGQQSRPPASTGSTRAARAGTARRHRRRGAQDRLRTGSPRT